MTTRPKHDHFTRDIKPPGSGCPACEAFWAKAREIGKEMEKQYGTKQEGLKRNPNKPVQRRTNAGFVSDARRLRSADVPSRRQGRAKPEQA